MKLWFFCEQFYGDKRIELLCLDLQNRYQVNVGLVLWLCWLAKTNRYIDREGFKQAESVSLAYHCSYIEPIRRLRKQSDIQGFSHSAQILQGLLNSEIGLERELLEKIECQFEAQIKSFATDETFGLVDYLRARDVTDPDALAQFLYAGAKSISPV